MLLVQKQPNFNLNRIQSTLHNQHRRHPSAPAPSMVVVQPTHTPGLLSLSKPQQRPQQRNARTPQAAKTIPTVAPSATNASPTSPSLPRGRQAKDKSAAVPRSDSVAAAAAPRQPVMRQPSPSQAEVPSMNSDASDPFLVSASASSPALSTRPSGKLAKRRQQHQHQPSTAPQSILASPPPVKAHAKPVSIPASSTTDAVKPISRSVPLPKPARHRKAESLRPGWDFPICDDSTEIGHESSFSTAPSFSEPVTPPRRRAPKPAPSPNSARKQRPRNHKRAPSDSGMVFNMSSDESGSENSRDEDLMAILNGMKMARQTAPSTPGHSAGFFASSMFQNSPSPDELPAPMFV